MLWFLCSGCPLVLMNSSPPPPGRVRALPGRPSQLEVRTLLTWRWLLPLWMKLGYRQHVQHTRGVHTALPRLPGKPTDWSLMTPPSGPPHGPLLEWQSENGHLKKVHSLNSHQEGSGPPWWELSECTFFKWPFSLCHSSNGPLGGGPKAGVIRDQSHAFSGFFREPGESCEHPYCSERTTCSSNHKPSAQVFSHSKLNYTCLDSLGIVNLHGMITSR
jgi:hypothetical protein